MVPVSGRDRRCRVFQVCALELAPWVMGVCEAQSLSDEDVHAETNDDL
jgi:hypothetical protein